MALHALFGRIVNMSLTASFVIAAVLLIRLPLKKAPKAFSYALWAVVLFRLLCPVSIESPVGVVPQAEAVTEGSYTLGEEPVSFSGTVTAVGRAIGDAASGGLGVQQVPSAESGADGAPMVASASRWDVWVLFGKYIAGYVWAGGAAALAVYSAVQYIRLRRGLVGAVPLRENIFLADHIGSPFVMGLFRPKIYLPSSLSGEEREYIILHERRHIRRGDHVVRVLAFAVLCVHWFNPLVWLAFVLSGKDMEMSCDEAVLKRMDGDIRAEYSASLLRFASGRRIVAGTPLAFGEGDTKARVKNVMKYKKPAFWVILAAVVVCAAAAVCLLTAPKASESGDPWILAEDGSGLPAPQGGEDPYADLAPAERAAAFLKNAELVDYELSPVLMYGRYVVPVVEYVPTAEVMPDPPLAQIDRTEYILEYLHSFDLSALEPCELTDTERYMTRSGVIRAGDARCRVTTWLCDNPAENPSADSVLAFTFTDGTMCAFDGGTNGANVTDIIVAIDMAGEGASYAQFGTGGSMTVTQLSTGTSRVSSPSSSAYMECLLDNTVLLGEPVEDESGSFGWQVSFRDGATYLFDDESFLFQTEDGRVFRLDLGEEDFEPSWTIRLLVVYGFDDVEPEESGDVEQDALLRMAAVTADDLKYISSYTQNEIRAEEFAPLLNAAAKHSVDDREAIWNFWEADVYLSGGPGVYSSDTDENFHLYAGLEENVVQIVYSDGCGGHAELYVEDEPLYWLLRNNYRSNGTIDPSFEQYRDIIEARGQEDVEKSAEYNIGGCSFSGYEVTYFQPVDVFESGDERYDVYSYSLAFTADDLTKVGWAGGMTLDSELRVCAYDEETYFVVRSDSSGRQEHRFLFYDLYFGPDEETGRENAWKTIQTAFEAS